MVWLQLRPDVAIFTGIDRSSFIDCSLSAEARHTGRGGFNHGAFRDRCSMVFALHLRRSDPRTRYSA